MKKSFYLKGVRIEVDYIQSFFIGTSTGTYVGWLRNHFLKHRFSYEFFLWKKKKFKIAETQFK